MKALGVFAACLMVVACGAGSDKAPPPASDADTAQDDEPDLGTLALALNPSAVAIAAGATQTVQVSISRDGAMAGASVELSTTGAIAGLSFAFDNTTTTEDTATLTITAAAGALATSGTVTVAGVGNTVSAAAVLSITLGTPNTITVNGAYLSSEGIPVAPRPVRLWSQGSATPVESTTANDGSFTFSNVTPPYDLAFLGTNEHYVVLGLTRPDPVIADNVNTEEQTTGTSIGWELTGDRYSNGVDTYGWYSYGAAVCPTANAVTAGIQPGDGVVLNGLVTDNSACDVYILQMTQSDDFINHQYSTGHVSQAAYNGQEYDEMIAMAERSAHTTTFTATNHAGADITVSSAQFWLPQVGIAVPMLPNYTDRKTAVPTDTTVAMSMVFYDGTDNGGVAQLTKLLGADTTLTAQTPKRLSIGSPANHDTVLPTTPITFTGTAGAVNQIVFSLQNNPAIVIVTQNTSFDGSVLTAHEVPLSTGDVAEIIVTVWDHIQSMDDFASAKTTAAALVSTDGAVQRVNNVLVSVGTW